MAQRSRSFLFMSCLLAAAVHPLLIVSRACFCASRPTNGLGTARRGLSIRSVTGRMAVPQRDGATATTDEPPQTVTRKDAEVEASQRPQTKQGSWAFAPRQSSDSESADDDGEVDLVALRRAALRLPEPKEKAERDAKQLRQEQVEAMYEFDGSIDEFTLPEKLAYMAGAAGVMWIWIMNAYKTAEHFGWGPHL